jgi:hypothetical protein
MQYRFYDRLSAIRGGNGKIDRDLVAALLDRPPRDMSIPELIAMQALDIMGNYCPAGLEDLRVTGAWWEEFNIVLGNTVTRQCTTLRDGRREVTKTTRRYRGRKDIRNYRRAIPGPVPSSRVRTRTREHRPTESRRASSSSTTSSADPGGDGPGEPPPPELRLWRHPQYGSINPNLLRLLLRAEVVA